MRGFQPSQRGLRCGYNRNRGLSQNAQPQGMRGDYAMHYDNRTMGQDGLEQMSAEVNQQYSWWRVNPQSLNAAFLKQMFASANSYLAKYSLPLIYSAHAVDG